MMKQCIATLALVVLSSLPVFAQSGASLGPQVGFHKPRDADETKVMGGAALRLRLDQSLGFEGSVGYREETYNNGSLTVKSWPIMVTGLVYPFPAIYGAVGAGWYNSTIDYNNYPPGSSSSETTQKFGWHFGGGAELPLGTSAKLVGDIRYVFLDYDFQTIPGTHGVNSDFYVISAGLLFNL